jgi:serine/threonine protein kinase
MERIGEYFVRRLIGEGGMGKVYEAEERLSRRKVALKVLRPELGRSEEGRQLFLNEMTILAHLDHPNIVRSLSCTEVDGELVMALEFLEGETLRERLARRGRLAWPEAVSIAAQVAAALGAAHGQEPPIVHRDLKPENLMIRGDERVVVMDFGIAKVLQAIRKSTAHSVGTLQYMSPEQVDAAEVDHRSDIYCLGLILYEVLAGHAPFQSESPRELLNLQCTAPPPPLPDDVRAQLPRGVERVLHRMLEKSPAARPDSAHEVLAALDPFVTAADGASSGQPRVTTAIGHAGGSNGVSSALPRPSGAQPVSLASSGAHPAVAPVAAARLDTIALLERAARPREVSTRLGLGIVLGLSILTGLVTYAVRASSPAASAAEAVSRAADGGAPDAGVAGDAGDEAPR